MRKFIYFFLAVLISAFQSGNSGDLSIVDIDIIEKSTNINEEWAFDIMSSVFNSSNETKIIKLKIDIISMPYGHSFGACWASGCLGSSIENWVGEKTFELKPYSKIDDFVFVGHYYCYYQDIACTPGVGKLRFTFFDSNNPNDSASIFATLTFSDGTGITNGYSQSNLEVNYMQSNLLRFTPEDNQESYSYSIISVNGFEVSNDKFSGETEVNLNGMSSGAYLYTVFDSKGKIIAKGKMLKN
ncbi:MAG: hypothetical protein A2X64_04635 [Ignavibacteria bacterium GWF2_33_9]|nr:MAG: hypothetical protein A2X64_04635 [Ignavibacteria bacterium GWF2_33_9]